MRSLKWLLYVVPFLVALLLIIPLFLPATFEISSQEGIMVSTAQVFHNVASYADIMSAVNAQGLQLAGAPFCHYLSCDEESGITECLAGIPTSAEGKGSGDILSKTYSEMEVLMAVHSGPYDELSASYGKWMEYIEANQIGVAGESFEFYHTGPASEPNVTKWRTLIAFPIK